MTHRDQPATRREVRALRERLARVEKAIEGRAPADAPGVAVQPAPVPGEATETVDLVVADIRARASFGVAKYGQPHRADNGRDHLVDLYQELIDGAVYVRAEIERRRIAAAYSEERCFDRPHGEYDPPCRICDRPPARAKDGAA